MRYQLKKPVVKSIEETLNKVITEKCSMCRFGDGEMFILLKVGGVGFQHYNEALSRKLKEALKSDDSNILICIHDSYGEVKADRIAEEKKYWREHLHKYAFQLFSILDTSKVYYNATCTRIYSIFSDKGKSKKLFELFKAIWKNREVVIIEGEKTKVGVGNDLLEGAKSIERILIPAEEAFNKYNQIYQEAIKLKKDKLILVSAGPTATILTYDLSKLGYQAIDIGHIDIEYEWFKVKAKERIPIRGKYVNEANYRNPEELMDEKYIKQIIARIE